MNSIKKKICALVVSLLCFAVGAVSVWADSQYVNEDQFYGKIDGVNVYISADKFLYHFSGEIPGVTICGYKGSLSKLTLPDEINGRAVSAIDDNVMAGNDKITALTVPSSVLAMGEGSFCGCGKLESVTLSGSVTELTGVFCDCPRLKEIVIPFGVTTVNNSFRNCIALRNVKFSRSVTELGQGSFNGCSAIEQIEWSTGLYHLGDAFDGSKMLSTIHIPKGIVTIDGAFDNCSFAERLELPDSVLYINSGFNGCSALRDVNLPEGLVYIGGAFGDCTSLRSVSIPPKTELNGAFMNCSQLSLDHRTDSPHFVLITLLVVALLCGGGYVVRKCISPNA